jgi:hypothetical protein
MMPRPSEIRDVVEQFVSRMSSMIEQDALARAREAILSAFGGDAPVGLSLRGGRGRGRALLLARGPGRPPGSKSRKQRRKGPIQLCPVPGCTNRAAPVFGMVCSKHKDLPKTEIRKYREQRRAAKEKVRKAA